MHKKPHVEIELLIPLGFKYDLLEPSLLGGLGEKGEAMGITMRVPSD